MSPTPKRHSRSYHYSRPSVKWKFPLNSSFYSVNTDQRQQEHDEDSKKRERSDRSKNPKYVKNEIHRNRRQVVEGNGKKANLRSKSVNDRFRSGERRNHIRSISGSESDRSFLPNGEIGKQSLPSVDRQVRRISFSRNRQRKEFASVQRVRKTSFSRRPLKMIVPDRIIRQRSSLSLTGIDGFDELNLQNSSWTRCFRATLREQKLLKYCLVIVTSITTVLILKHRLLATPPSSPVSHMPSVEPSSMPSDEPSEIPLDAYSSVPSSWPSLGSSEAISNLPSEAFHAYGYDRGKGRPNVYPTHYSLSPSPSNQPMTAVPNIWMNVDPSSVPSTHKSEIPSIQKNTSPSMISVSVEPSSEIKYQTNVPSIAMTSIKYSSMIPSKLPSTAPTQVKVLKLPSQFPSSLPTGTFTLSPSRNTSLSPSKEISIIPSVLLSVLPSSHPSLVSSTHPSSEPSSKPTLQLSLSPSVLPSSHPSLVSSTHPSSEPSSTPTLQLSLLPSDEPSITPTSKPSLLTSNKPSILHTSSPSKQLTLSPTALKGTDTTDPSLSCVDDPDFEFEIINTSTTVRRTRNCAWLTSEPQRAQIRIDRFCYSSVLENCRQTCSSC